MKKIKAVREKAILYITLKKEAGAKKCFCFSGWGRNAAVVQKRLQCFGALDNTLLIVYELPASFTMLQGSSRLQKRARRQIERILRGCDEGCAILYEEKLKETLALQPHITTFFCQGMVQELMLLHDGQNRNGGYDGVHKGIEEVWLIDAGEAPLALLQTIYGGLNRLTIITRQPDAYEELIRDVYEDTGLVTVCMTQMSEESAGKGLPLVIDMDDGSNMPYRRLPHGALYIDLCPDCFKRRSIQLKRSDVHYTDYWKFLDSCKKNTV